MSLNTYSDKELFVELNRDNTLAFSVLFDRYSDVLFRFIFKRTGSVSDSQDILQEVFLSVWNKRTKIEVGESLYPYLFRASKYEVIDWLVRNDKRSKCMERLVVGHYPEPFCSTSEEELMAKELETLLAHEVDSMPLTMQSVFKLSRVEDMSIKEIAAQLSISEQTVKNNISLAISRLRLLVK
ncbi:RNA polymerase sigma factor [Sphingobacterium sp. SYP-B4668]|uniref:RNA polymerase sigma factor n=1 Tax=Sphingobacterium sp. SYP-B4668 TaxID=2996035 RepID=UPI0022DD1A4A|nr:sigma-70 family RNA polymerase sigma factor [Sphingobacterium sp. SYP-B4668]